MVEDYIISRKRSANIKGGDDPALFEPEPTVNDYRNGFITRYFARATNGSQKITEIDEIQFRSYNTLGRGLNAKIYEVFSINWKISGPRNDIYKGKIPVRNGVEDTNSNILELTEESYAGISDYLDDPLEFWEGRNNNF